MKFYTPSSKNYEKNWNRIFNKRYPRKPNKLCEMYVKNVRLFFSDCPECTDYYFMRLIESQLRFPCLKQVVQFRRSVLQTKDMVESINRVFKYNTHTLLKLAILSFLGYRDPVKASEIDAICKKSKKCLNDN